MSQRAPVHVPNEQDVAASEHCDFCDEIASMLYRRLLLQQLIFDNGITVRPIGLGPKVWKNATDDMGLDLRFRLNIDRDVRAEIIVVRKTPYGDWKALHRGVRDVQHPQPHLRVATPTDLNIARAIFRVQVLPEIEHHLDHFYFEDPQPEPRDPTRPVRAAPVVPPPTVVKPQPVIGSANTLTTELETYRQHLGLVEDKLIWCWIDSGPKDSTTAPTRTLNQEARKSVLRLDRGAAVQAAIAWALSGCEGWEQFFSALSLPDSVGLHVRPRHLLERMWGLRGAITALAHIQPQETQARESMQLAIADEQAFPVDPDDSWLLEG